MNQTAGSLNGLRVLVLEDEVLVSMMVEDMLDELGCVVVGPFATLADALERIAAGGGIDLALLDVNVGKTLSFPAAEALASAGTPFIFSTGHDANGLPEEWRGRPSLSKPFMLPQLERALKSALGI